MVSVYLYGESPPVNFKSTFKVGGLVRTHTHKTAISWQTDRAQNVNSAWHLHLTSRDSCAEYENSANCSDKSGRPKTIIYDDDWMWRN